MALTGLQLDGAIMHDSVHWLSLHYLVAQVTATLLVLFMWNFAVSGMPAVGYTNVRWKSKRRLGGPRPRWRTAAGRASVAK